MERGRIAAALPRLTAIASDSVSDDAASNKVRGIASAIRLIDGRLETEGLAEIAARRAREEGGELREKWPVGAEFVSILLDHVGRAKTGARIRAGSPPRQTQHQKDRHRDQDHDDDRLENALAARKTPCGLAVRQEAGWIGRPFARATRRQEPIDACGTRFSPTSGARL